MSPLALFAAWTLAAYGSVLLLVEGTIFNRPRNWLTSRSTLLREFFSCPMCLAFWVGAVLSLGLDLGPVRFVSIREHLGYRLALAWCDGAATSCAVTFLALIRLRLMPARPKPEARPATPLARVA